MRSLSKTSLAPLKCDDKMPSLGTIESTQAGLDPSRPDKSLSWMLINFIRRNRWLYRTVYFLGSIKRNGIKKTSGISVINGQSHRSFLKTEIKLTKHKRISEENTVFPQKITISVIVPLCDTPEQFLMEMIESVAAQTYGCWELCLADGSGTNHEYAGDICRK